MALTSQQKTTLKAFIAADPVMSVQLPGSGGSYPIADLLNQTANPAFIVWKTSVSIDEIMRNGMDWARVDNLTIGKARIWDWLGRLGSFDASKANVRAGIDACWVGTAADLAVRASVYTHCKRSANRIEKLFATGTGSDAVPATMVFEGNITPDEVQDARES
jgi:hypothetical protein